jgi:hypothetical protein
VIVSVLMSFMTTSSLSRALAPQESSGRWVATDLGRSEALSEKSFHSDDGESMSARGKILAEHWSGSFGNTCPRIQPTVHRRKGWKAVPTTSDSEIPPAAEQRETNVQKEMATRILRAALDLEGQIESLIV